MLDAIDLQILTIMQDNAKTSNAEIARRIGMAPSGVLERIRKLEERGIIRGYVPQLNAKALGHGLLAFVFVKTDEMAGEHVTALKLSQLPEVQEVHHVAGEDCYIVKVRTADTEALGRLLRERIGGLAAVKSTRTTIVLETVKESMTLPIGVLSSDDSPTHHEPRIPESGTGSVV
jgi:Lrp/AsnC family transcriptional regulator, leucine-responsive regulatory protein